MCMLETGKYGITPKPTHLVYKKSSLILGNINIHIFKSIE